MLADYPELLKSSRKRVQEERLPSRKAIAIPGRLPAHREAVDPSAVKLRSHKVFTCAQQRPPTCYSQAVATYQLPLMVIGLMPLHSIQECIFRGSEGFAADFLRFANRLALHFICVLDSFGVDDKMIEDGDLVFSLVTTRRLSHGPELRDQIVVDDREHEDCRCR